MPWDNKYRPLREGETILAGDECLTDSHLGWQPATHDIGGKAPDPNYTSHRMYRRLIGHYGQDPDRVFAMLSEHFLDTIHHWPAFPPERARWWQVWLWDRDAKIDAAMKAIGWPRFTNQMCRRYWKQVRYGQDVCEDAGGYLWRCWCAALGLPFREPSCTYSGYIGAGEDPGICKTYVSVMRSLGGDRA